MSEYNQMQLVKRRMYAMRNGIVADALRRNSPSYRMIFGLNLPQIAEIAASQPQDAAFSAELWADRRTRESLLLAPMLYPPAEMDEATALAWMYDVRDTEVADPATQADYVLTHFTLDMPRLEGGDIFIDGDLTQRRLDPLSRMVWNNATGRYELSLLLKQGAYNYQYLFVPSGAERGETAPVEGDNYQTVNEYTVRVYHRPRGSRSDRLVGVSTITTGK